MNHNQSVLIDQAVSGDKQSLETLLLEVQDLVFNLSLRMLGTIPDAEDASQEIMIRVMTNLGTFRRESSFQTWVFRIATNHLINYQKGMFAKMPLSFEYYGADIKNGRTEDIPDLSQGVDSALLEEELKYSCTNVMLQCLDPESRCIFVLGTMFQADSRIAGELLGLTPAAYRQRLSRIKKKVADFLDEYCGLSGKGCCNCAKRTNYAIQTHRLNPQSLEYSQLHQAPSETLAQFKSAMEEIDDYSIYFSTLPAYHSTDKAKTLLREFLNSDSYQIICNA